MKTYAFCWERRVGYWRNIARNSTLGAPWYMWNRYVVCGIDNRTVYDGGSPTIRPFVSVFLDNARSETRSLWVAQTKRSTTAVRVACWSVEKYFLLLRIVVNNNRKPQNVGGIVKKKPQRKPQLRGHRTEIVIRPAILLSIEFSLWRQIYSRF